MDLDSGCSRNMTGNQSKFVNFSKKDGGLVTFGDNKESKIIGEGTIANDTCTLIEELYLIKIIA